MFEKLVFYFRNKIAHNGSLSKEECEEFRKICEDINIIIDGAYKKLDTFQLSMSDQEALVKATNEFAEKNNYTQLDSCTSVYEVINEVTLLEELRRAEEELDFVGLRYFVVTILGEKGYDYASSFVLINHLVDKGVLEMKQITNESNHQTTVISISNAAKGQD